MLETNRSSKTTDELFAASVRPEMLSALLDANSILLCTHKNPDGDAIGSTLALGNALKALGKQVTMCCTDKVPAVYAFLQGAEEILMARDVPQAHFDAVVALDVAVKNRLGDAEKLFDAAPMTLQWDHHGTNPCYAMLNAVEADTAATGCIVRRLIRAIGCEITPEIAQCLYCAISTDTGNFCFDSVNEDVFEACLDLLRCGLQLSETARKVHLLREEAHVRLLARALATLKLFANGRAAGMVLTGEDYEAAGALPENSDKIVNYALDLFGVQMAYLVDGRLENAAKVSLRAVQPRNVAVIAASLGGGGHDLAAGATCAMTVEETVAAVEKAMTKQLQEGE